uniref:Galactose-1-phosphate uridyl transferase N-terminal domain-containing protein n=1 Tax=Parascaris equorum TaxID=6256 RepID=A0A914RLD1_PAREQ
MLRSTDKCAGATEADTKSKDGFPTLTTINPLAPGGKRANGKTSPNYTSTYVFENDFPSAYQYRPLGELRLLVDPKLLKGNWMRSLNYYSMVAYKEIKMIANAYHERLEMLLHRSPRGIEYGLES